MVKIKKRSVKEKFQGSVLRKKKSVTKRSFLINFNYLMSFKYKYQMNIILFWMIDLISMHVNWIDTIIRNSSHMMVAINMY